MRTKRNTLLNLMGAVVPIGVTLITVPIFLQLIGAERYGTLAILWALMGYFGFMDLGLGRAIAQRLASPVGRSPFQRSGLVWTALAMTALLGTVAGIILWLSADFILSHWIDMTPENLAEAKGAVPWFVAALPLIFSASILNGALHGRQNFLAMNLLAITGGTLAQLLPLTVAALGHVSLGWLVPAALGAHLITFAINFSYCRRHLPLRLKPHFHPEHLKPLFSYGGWVSVMSIMAPLLVTIDRMVIGALAGAKAVAFYTVPYSIVTKLMALSRSLHSAIFPRLASAQEHEANMLVEKSSRALLAVMTFMVLVLIPVIHPFLILWVGSDFATQAQGIGEVILLGVLINSIVIPHHSWLMAKSRVRAITLVYLIQIPFYFFFLWFGLSYLGVIGAALAWTVRILMDTVLLLWISGTIEGAIKYSLVPIFLVTASVVSTRIFPWNDLNRWTIAVLLILIAVGYNWRTIQKGFGYLFKRQVVVTT